MCRRASDRCHPGGRALRYLLASLLFGFFMAAGQAGAGQRTAQEADGVWTEHQAPTTTSARDLDMLSDGYGWAVGSGGGASSGVLMGWDGREWTVQVSSAEALLSGVDIISEVDGWAVGVDGTILYWNGLQWNVQPSPTTIQLTSISMVSADDGWAVGGYVPRPTNAGEETQVILRWNGESWQTYREGPGSFLHAVRMFAPDDGWAVGNNGTILHWDGSSWNSVPSPTDLSVNAIDMVSPGEGWAGGDDNYGGHGFFLHWNGSRWSEVASPVFSGLRDVEMVASDDGWATAAGGRLLRWDGQRWREVEGPDVRLSGAVTTVGADSVWFAASNGVFLQYREKGTPPPVGCGTWIRQATTEEKDIRIETVLTDVDAQPPCQGKFRLKNNTAFYTFGGYTMGLVVQGSSTQMRWVPDFGGDLVLPPILDVEAHAIPLDAAEAAHVDIQGEISVRGAILDSALFLLRGALSLTPPGTGCLVPDEAILAAALRTAIILDETANLAFRGDFDAAYHEFLQIGAHFYERSAEAFAEIGYDCAFDILIDLAKKPALILKLGVDWIVWVGKVYWDYWEFQGRSADVTLVYTPVTPPTPTPTPAVTQTEVILIEPTTYNGEEQEGSCWTRSIATPREGAWRCMVENRIHDPCFSSPAFSDAVICHPSWDGNGGFKLNLTEPLPTNSNPVVDDSALGFELADEAICSFLSTGTSIYGETGRPIWYECDDGTQIEGRLQPGQVWTAKRVRILNNAGDVEELGEFAIRRVWR